MSTEAQAVAATAILLRRYHSAVEQLVPTTPWPERVRRTELMLEAAKSWAEHARRVNARIRIDALNLAPIASTLPTPDGWDDRVGSDSAPYWELGGASLELHGVRLGYLSGWFVYRDDEPTFQRECFNLGESLGDALDAEIRRAKEAANA